MSRRLICSWERSATGWSGRGRAELAVAMGASFAVVGLELGQNRPQVSFPEDHIQSVISVPVQ